MLVVYVTSDPLGALAVGTKVVIMKDGRVMQVDDPMDLYERPTSLFAAQFFGTPPINTFECDVEENADSGVGLRFGTYFLPLPPSKAADLRKAGYIGKKVLAGLRPEDIKDEEIFVDTSPAPLDATILVREMLGAITYLDIRIGDTQMVASVNPRTAARSGEQMRLAFDMRKIHLFDMKTLNIIGNG